ncbi:uncharacterized protein B0H18DRAFT_1117935 [Fomitopsis serialis]|uniref:uncharacterized protein n=1 Tax=Fomitopsis serialis TaxID=139415 RepID=UPI002007594A|nr:uncharacterized protein B0H18DRAFT_1117935 [Neoantrodia serialis]KAH9928755.1 hypothetical protein B0H18DRAFT_1117935 [Neoantrodia serialis]
MAGNQAVSENPPYAQEHLSTNGSDWLWTVFSIMALGTLLTAGAAIMRPRGTRFFHQLAVIILTTSSIAYFSMASDLGATPITAEFRGNETRQIWYVRYIQWFINFPTLLLAMLLATSLPLSDIVTTLFMSLVIVVSGLVGALVHSTYKWGYYTFGVVALFYIWYVLLWHAPASSFVAAVSRECHHGHLRDDLVRHPRPLHGPIFLALFLWQLRDIDYEAFGHRSGMYANQNATAVRGEKVAPPVAAAATGPAPAAAPAPTAAAPQQTV